MAASEVEMLSESLHRPEEVFPAAHCQKTLLAHAPETLCYFFCWKGSCDARWVVAPWSRLGEECGLILATDASFYCHIGEFGSVYAAYR